MTPFRYSIRSKALAKSLEDYCSFTIYHRAPDRVVVEAPAALSATAARKVIHTMIGLHQAEKAMSQATAKYERLVLQSSEGSI
jgi:hypothetical protein